MFRRSSISTINHQTSIQHTQTISNRHKITATLIAIFLLFGLSIGYWLWSDPAHQADAADLARTIFGPGPVGQVEGLVFQLQDAMHGAQYQATGNTSTINSIEWAEPVVPQGQSQTPQAIPVQPLQPAHHTSQPATTNNPAPAAGEVGNPALIGTNWSTFIADQHGNALMERTIIAPDPTRPYVRAAAVRIDLTKTEIHLVAGTIEPTATLAIARPGTIPASVIHSGLLLAAFNGGFKAANGHFGMAIGHTTYIPARNGVATLAIYRDGSLRLGVWGEDISASPDIIAFRQNCPLMVRDGQITDLVNQDDIQLWGKTVHNKIATWRSGLGLSADGRYLIYVVGDGLTVPTLAEALVESGADRGMQLDINSFWTRFVTFAANGHTLIAQKLLSGMPGHEQQFLAPDTRDFFYITRRN